MDTTVHSAPERSFWRLAIQWLAVGGAYYIAAALSLELALVGDSVTPLWPSTGIALVGYLVFGYRVWPAVALAAFLVNWPIGPTAGTAGWIAIGNTVAPAAAAGLLRASGFRVEVDRTRDAVGLVLLGALASMTISATVGSLALQQAGVIGEESFWSTWAVWWAGDAMGILAVAPFVLGLLSMRFSGIVDRWRVGEVVVTFGALGYTAFLLNDTARPVWVAVFPLLVWTAWRFQQRGAGPAALIVIAAASWAAAHDAGPFMGSELVPKMVSLQIFNAAVALTSFFFAAVVAERIADRRELDRSAREMYQREHRIAETLQRSLLPDSLPSTPDLKLAARYIPATDEVEVGGDWYDIIPLPDGRLGLVIGDVAGHGVAAAAAMGQIRMALRAYGLELLPPARALERLNGLIIELQPGAMATLIYAHLDPETGRLTMAKAGHPPPLVVTADGRSSYIEGGLAPPLGVSGLVSYVETTTTLAPGSTLLFYTDGLIERRGQSIDEGLDRLARAALGAPRDLEAASDHFVETLVGTEGFDDTAILAVRRVDLAGEPLVLMLPAQPARLASMRRSLSRWLRQNGFDEEAAGEVVLAATEACTNAIQHAYGSKEGWMEIEATRADDHLDVRVRDFGGWAVRPADDVGGRGIPLIRALMDDIEINSDAEGTEVRMRRRVATRVDHG